MPGIWGYGFGATFNIFEGLGVRCTVYGPVFRTIFCWTQGYGLGVRFEISARTQGYGFRYFSVMGVRTQGYGPIFQDHFLPDPGYGPGVLFEISARTQGTHTNLRTATSAACLVSEALALGITQKWDI